MLDFLGYTKGGIYYLPKDTRMAFDRWAAGQPDAAWLTRIIKKMATRSDEHHKLYRLRNAVLAPHLNTDTDSLHDHIKLELDMTEEYTIAGKTKTRLRSQKEFTTEEMSAMFLKQDELRDFVNLDREPHNYLLLPTGDPLERI